MAMVHHDKRSYEVAVSEAAATFRKKLEDRFKLSVPRVQRVIEQVQNDVPEDMLIRGDKLHFDADKNSIAIVPPKQDALILHPHALAQVAEKAKVKNFGSFVNDLKGRGDWGMQLIAQNLNEIYSRTAGQNRFLVRNVRHEVRGFLSDQYRRLDSHEMLDAFVAAMQKFGARPIDGFALQTKIKVRCFIPQVFEPFPGELLAIGAELSDSDYGDGFLSLSMIGERMWCTNLATLQDVLKQVHIGKRLPENIQLSQNTYRLDTKAMASLINDLASHVLGPGAVNGYLDLVRQANEQKVDAREIAAWVKKNLNKEEGQKLIEKFTSPDIELLPAGQTKWRWSNALSWLANETEDERHKLELQELAGAVVNPGKKSAAKPVEPEYLEAEVVA